MYFGAPVSALTVTQGAFLAGLIQAPSSYDPIRRPDASRTRYKIVLARLVDVGLITPEVATATCAGWEKPKVRTLVDAECVIPEQVSTIPQQDVNRSYFTEEVKDYLLNRSTLLGATYQDRYNKLFRGGLKIYTTLNKKDQIAAEAAAAAQLPENKTGIQAAVVSIDNATGECERWLVARALFLSATRSTLRYEGVKLGQASRCLSWRLRYRPEFFQTT